MLKTLAVSCKAENVFSIWIVGAIDHDNRWTYDFLVVIQEERYPRGHLRGRCGEPVVVSL